VFYENNKELASKISKAISDSTGFSDRGVETKELEFSKKAKTSSIIICLVTDEEHFKSLQEKCKDICGAIAQTISTFKNATAVKTLPTINGKKVILGILVGFVAVAGIILGIVFLSNNNNSNNIDEISMSDTISKDYISTENYVSSTAATTIESSTAKETTTVTSTTTDEPTTNEGTTPDDVFHMNLEGEGITNEILVEMIMRNEIPNNVTSLNLNNNQLTDITVLTGLTELTTLYLGNNQIEDISSLSALTNLTDLILDTNLIVDLAPLSGLSELTSLTLSNNNIVDLSSLSELFNLTSLKLESNPVVDISPLAELTNLTVLSLSKAQITDEQASELEDALPLCSIVFS
jgi:Leucine-rich repeat (LRR) protein